MKLALSFDYKLSDDAKTALQGVVSKSTLRALERGECVLLYSGHLNRIVERAAKQKTTTPA